MDARFLHHQRDPGVMILQIPTNVMVPTLVSKWCERISSNCMFTFVWGASPMADVWRVSGFQMNVQCVNGAAAKMAGFVLMGHSNGCASKENVFSYVKGNI